MNNILEHFATAYFDLYLKGEPDKQAYLDVVPNGKDAVFAIDRDGKPAARHTPTGRASSAARPRAW